METFWFGQVERAIRILVLISKSDLTLSIPSSPVVFGMNQQYAHLSGTIIPKWVGLLGCFSASVIVLRFKLTIARLKAAQGRGLYGHTGTLLQHLNTTSPYVPLVSQRVYYVRRTTHKFFGNPIWPKASIYGVSGNR